MKKGIYFALILALALILWACGGETVPTTQPPAAQTTAPVPETTQPVPETTLAPTEPTKPPHSALYLPEYTPEQILEYFEEVVLHVEYSTGSGDATLVQKWLAPIRYRIDGSPTQEDLAVLAELFDQLNEVPGFPGILEATGDEVHELTLSFLEPEPFDAAFSEILNGESAFGATQFWYDTDSNEIYSANIGYRTDLDQSVRSSILVEEIINTLGITDTELRTDSIVYQYSDDNLTLSDVDWIILKLLYDPAVRCGMNLDECREIILELYY